MTEQRRLEIEVHGRVQGVAFRWSTQERAAALGLSGWVRNQPEGSVLIVAEGDPEALRSLRHWCEVGPPRARVERVRVLAEGPAEGRFGGFSVRT